MSQKYRERLSRGSGTSNKKFECAFGLKMLQKFGWSEGKGLGKDLDGRTDCVQVKKREDGCGIGAEEGGNSGGAVVQSSPDSSPRASDEESANAKPAPSSKTAANMLFSFNIGKKGKDEQNWDQWWKGAYDKVAAKGSLANASASPSASNSDSSSSSDSSDDEGRATKRGRGARGIQFRRANRFSQLVAKRRGDKAPAKESSSSSDSSDSSDSDSDDGKKSGTAAAAVPDFLAQIRARQEAWKKQQDAAAATKSEEKDKSEKKEKSDKKEKKSKKRSRCEAAAAPAAEAPVAEKDSKKKKKKDKKEKK